MKMVLARTIPSTKPLNNYQPNTAGTVCTMIGTKHFILGMLCLDMGAIILLALKKWCRTHGVTIKLNSGVIITSALGKALEIMGMASLTMMLAPILKVDLGKIAVSLGEFY